MNHKTDPSRSQTPQSIVVKIAALSVPAGVVLAAAFLPLSPFVRQALVGIMLMWVMLGVLMGFSFFG